MKSNVKDNEIVDVLQQINVEGVRQLKEKKRNRIKEQNEISYK